MSEDPATPHVLLELWDHVASVARDGLTGSSGAREIRMTPDQLIALAQFLSDAEIQVLGLFLRDMQVTRTAEGERFYVEGFTRDYVFEAGVRPANRARNGLSGLIAKGILVDENPGSRARYEKSWKTLVGAWFAKHTVTGEQHPRSRRASSPGARGGDRIVAGQSMGEVSTGGLSANGHRPVDNPTGGLSAGGDPACGKPDPDAATAQVNATGGFATGGLTAATRKEGIRKFSTSPTPTDRPRTAAVAAFARDPQMRSRMVTHGEDVLRQVRSAAASDTHRDRAEATLLFFLCSPGADPVAQVLDLALGLLVASGAEAQGNAEFLRSHFAAVKAHHPRGLSEDDLLTGAALAMVSALDAPDPIKSFPSWFAKLLKPEHQWRQDGVVGALLRVLAGLAQRPADDPTSYGAATVDNPAYVAELDRAREVIWSIYPDARDDVSWSMVVATPSRHQRVLDLAREVQSGKWDCPPPPANWREIAAGLADPDEAAG